MNIRHAHVIVILLLMACVGCSKTARESGAESKAAQTQGSGSSTQTNSSAVTPSAVSPVSPSEAAAALRPPAGAKLAIVVFEDLQCPACSQVEPLIAQAAQNYKIPVVRHDYVIPNHNWSPDAHVFARFFDTQSPAIGEAYRHWILENQRTINKSNVREKTEQFAAAHKVNLPLFVDPNGELAAKVKADGNVGKALGINETPTIYVVSSAENVPASKVQDRDKLFETIDQVKRATESAAASKPKMRTKAAQGLEQ